MAVEKSVSEDAAKIQYPRSWYGARHTQCIMLFLLHILGYGTKVNLSVGIVAMTDPEGNPNKDIPTYDWDNNSVILSSFFWGYFITQLPGGQLGKIYGPKRFLVTCMFINGLFCCLIPPMATFGSRGVIFCRVIQGLAQGCSYPLCHTMLGKWAPLEERSRLGTFVYAGASFGTVVCLIATGLISSSPLGWPYVFYIYGILGMIWSISYFIIGSNSPAQHPKIDPIERVYIQTSLGQTSEQKLPQTPWKAIFTSRHVWALIVAHAGQNWGYWTLLTNIPTFLKGVLDFDLQQNGFLSAGPYLTLWILSFIFSGIADTAIKSKLASVGLTRKVSNSIGLYVPAITLIILGQISSSKDDVTDVILALLFIAVGSNAGTYSGYLVNHIDISPIHAGTLIGITNGIASICSLIGPLILQWIVTDEKDTTQWATAFYIASGFYIFANSVFVIFGSGEVQPWNSIETGEYNKNVP